jgi:hypothetical protein
MASAGPLLGIHFAQKRSVVMGVACPSRALTSVMGALAAKSHDGNVCRVEAGGRRLGKATTNGPIGRHKVTRPTSKRPAESGIVAPSTLSR